MIVGAIPGATPTGPTLDLSVFEHHARAGRRAFLDTTDVTEFDLVRIGDDAALNDESAVQTHLFEDRIMKTGVVEIGDRVVLGAHAIALYGSHLEDGSRLGPLSLAMKGERLPAGTSWMGSPARLIRAGQPVGSYRARAVVSLVGVMSTWHLVSAASTII